MICFRDKYPVCHVGDGDGDTGCGPCLQSLERCRNCITDLCNVQPRYLLEAQYQREEEERKREREVKGESEREKEKEKDREIGHCRK
jgi:hypothetical protein